MSDPFQDGPPTLPRSSLVLVRGAFVASAALVLLLHFGAGVPLRHALLLPLLLLLLPAMGVAQAPLVSELRADDRTSLYGVSGATILLLGALSVGVGLPGPGSGAMGLVLPPVGTLLRWSLLLLGAAGGIIVLFHLATRIAGYREPAYLELLLPRTGREKAGFALLSAAAGVGEEAAYRAYGIATIVSLGGSAWLAVAVTSLSFGLLHGYQGSVGVARTGSLGAVFAISLLRWETVVPAMIVHMAVDLLIGLWIGDRLLPSRRGAGAEDRNTPSDGGMISPGGEAPPGDAEASSANGEAPSDGGED